MVFNKPLLVLKKIEGELRPKNINMDWCSFIVQIHGLPFGLMIEKIKVIIGEVIGDVIEIEFKEDKSTWSKFFKVRVLIISQSL